MLQQSKVLFQQEINFPLTIQNAAPSVFSAGDIFQIFLNIIMLKQYESVNIFGIVL